MNQGYQPVDAPKNPIPPRGGTSETYIEEMFRDVLKTFIDKAYCQADKPNTSIEGPPNEYVTEGIDLNNEYDKDISALEFDLEVLQKQNAELKEALAEVAMGKKGFLYEVEIVYLDQKSGIKHHDRLGLRVPNIGALTSAIYGSYKYLDYFIVHNIWCDNVLLFERKA